jgi:hypothetical protein
MISKMLGLVIRLGAKPVSLSGGKKIHARWVIAWRSSIIGHYRNYLLGFVSLTPEICLLSARLRRLHYRHGMARNLPLGSPYMDRMAATPCTQGQSQLSRSRAGIVWPRLMTFVYVRKSIPRRGDVPGRPSRQVRPNTLLVSCFVHLP